MSDEQTCAYSKSSCKQHISLITNFCESVGTKLAIVQQSISLIASYHATIIITAK